MNGRDKWLDRIVLLSMALTVILGGIGLVYLAAARIEIPPSLTALTGSAVGLLAGWFGRSVCAERRNKEEV